MRASGAHRVISPYLNKITFKAVEACLASKFLVQRDVLANLAHTTDNFRRFFDQPPAAACLLIHCCLGAVEVQRVRGIRA